MDLVNRLKFFMESQQIANSQFADSCRIPRPTLSQLLNGRNKKISDELIGKIHEAYPNLSVLWLMFGEGSMIIDENIEISEPQNSDGDGIQSGLQPDLQTNTFDSNVIDSLFEIDSNKFSQPQTALPAIEHKEIGIQTEQPTTKKQAQNTKVSISTDRNKKINSIVVFYSDNSFQSFTPAD